MTETSKNQVMYHESLMTDHGLNADEATVAALLFGKVSTHGALESDGLVWLAITIPTLANDFKCRQTVLRSATSKLTKAGLLHKKKAMCVVDGKGRNSIAYAFTESAKKYFKE